MNTAQLTPRALDVIAASDEYTAPIFRAPSVGCFPLTPREQLLRSALVRLCNSYAFIKPPGYPKSDSEKQAEAAIAATAATGIN